MHMYMCTRWLGPQLGSKTYLDSTIANQFYYAQLNGYPRNEFQVDCMKPGFNLHPTNSLLRPLRVPCSPFSSSSNKIFTPQTFTPYKNKIRKDILQSNESANVTAHNNATQFLEVIKENDVRPSTKRIIEIKKAEWKTAFMTWKSHLQQQLIKYLILIQIIWPSLQHTIVCAGSDFNRIRIYTLRNVKNSWLWTFAWFIHRWIFKQTTEDAREKKKRTNEKRQGKVEMSSFIVNRFVFYTICDNMRKHRKAMQRVSERTKLFEIQYSFFPWLLFRLNRFIGSHLTTPRIKKWMHKKTIINTVYGTAASMWPTVPRKNRRLCEKKNSIPLRCAFLARSIHTHNWKLFSL